MRTDDAVEEHPELRDRHRTCFVALGAGAHHIRWGRPVCPRECRREPLAAELRVREAHDRPPGAAVEHYLQASTIGVVEQQKVDLVRELVLDYAPRERAGVEQVGVE